MGFWFPEQGSNLWPLPSHPPSPAVEAWILNYWASREVPPWLSIFSLSLLLRKSLLLSIYCRKSLYHGTQACWGHSLHPCNSEKWNQCSISWINTKLTVFYLHYEILYSNLKSIKIYVGRSPVYNLFLCKLSGVWVPATTWTVACQASLSFPGKNTGVGCHFLLHQYIRISGIKQSDDKYVGTTVFV